MENNTQTNSIIKITVPNAEQEKFREAIKKIPKGEYEVESLKNGNTIIINKLDDNDFVVHLYNPKDGSKKSYSHNELFLDIGKKQEADEENSKKLINGLLDVCKGKEPDKAIEDCKVKESVGLPLDQLFKIYKWIWGQEDINYEFGEGRWLSMKHIQESYGENK